MIGLVSLVNAQGASFHPNGIPMHSKSSPRIMNWKYYRRLGCKAKWWYASLRSILLAHWRQLLANLSILRFSNFIGLSSKWLLMCLKSTTRRNPPEDFGTKKQREMYRLCCSSLVILRIAPELR